MTASALNAMARAELAPDLLSDPQSIAVFTPEGKATLVEALAVVTSDRLIQLAFLWKSTSNS